MKPYHELDCDVLPAIQKEALQWLNERYDLSDQSSLKTELWLKIDTKDFFKSNVSLRSWVRTLNLFCREVAVTVINDMSGAGLHIDEPPVTAKINVPILNYRNVINEWYHVPESVIASVDPWTNRFGSKFYYLDSIDIARCDLLGSIEIKSPVVFNSQIPHRVVCLDGAKFPRVVLTCMFADEPINYLK